MTTDPWQPPPPPIYNQSNGIQYPTVFIPHIPNSKETFLSKISEYLGVASEYHELHSLTPNMHKVANVRTIIYQTTPGPMYNGTIPLAMNYHGAMIHISRGSAMDIYVIAHELGHSVVLESEALKARGVQATPLENDPEAANVQNHAARLNELRADHAALCILTYTPDQRTDVQLGPDVAKALVAGFYKNRSPATDGRTPSARLSMEIVDAFEPSQCGIYNINKNLGKSFQPLVAEVDAKTRYAMAEPSVDSSLTPPPVSVTPNQPLNARG